MFSISKDDQTFNLTQFNEGRNRNMFLRNVDLSKSEMSISKPVIIS